VKTQVEVQGRTVTVRNGAAAVTRTYTDETTAAGVAARLRKSEASRDRFMRTKGR